MSSAPSSSSLNGHGAATNGISHAEAPIQHEILEATPSTSFAALNGYTQTPYQMHNEEIVHHLYHAGFQTGNYADTTLHVHQNTYRLHAIILSRSPYLAHLMSTSPQSGGQRVIYVNLEHEPEVTKEGFAIALGYLYSSVSLNLVRAETARAVLAAGCLLGGMDDLCAYAYDTCRRTINVENIGRWLAFSDSSPSSPDGTSTPELPPPSVFGLYAQRLREDVFNFLVVSLPNILYVHDPAGAADGRERLLQIFAQVPFEMFKAAVESPTFQIGSEQARFQFAKDAIALRKRGIGRSTGAEETVVLAFGGNTGPSEGSAVHITRKVRRRPLWKVNS